MSKEILHTKCCYCRRPFNDEDQNLKITREHFIPISRSGKGGVNILYSCQECNKWKSDKPVDFWLNKVVYLESKKSLHGTYSIRDYRQIVGSIRHWTKFFKGKKVSDYKY